MNRIVGFRRIRMFELGLSYGKCPNSGLNTKSARILNEGLTSLHNGTSGANIFNFEWHSATRKTTQNPQNPLVSIVITIPVDAL
jgi:hypothetical protein